MKLYNIVFQTSRWDALTIVLVASNEVEAMARAKKLFEPWYNDYPVEPEIEELTLEDAVMVWSEG
jgi:hypothetical protein